MRLYRPVLDDRGRRITPIDAGEVGSGDDEQSQSRTNLARRLKHALAHESQRVTSRGLLIGIALLVVIALILVPAFRLVSSVSFWVPEVVFFGTIGLLSLVARSTARRRAGPELAATIVAEGFCAACGYSLEGLARQDDGCVLCPECDAAWNADRITWPHWTERDDDLIHRPGVGVMVLFRLHPRIDRLMAPDARGRYVKVVDSRLRSLTRARRDRIGAEEVDRLRGELRIIGLFRRSVLSLLIVAIGWWLASLTMLFPPSTTVIPTLILILIAIALGTGMYLSHAFIASRRIAAVMADEGRCAACARDLRDLTPAGDGCVVCPDCGSAWRIGGEPRAE